VWLEGLIFSNKKFLEELIGRSRKLLLVPPAHSMLVSGPEVKVEVTLRLTVSKSLCLGMSTLVGLATTYYFLSEWCCLVSVGCPLWREDGSAVCSVITQWSESLRNRNHILLSHLRLPQPGGLGSRIYIPLEQGGPVIPPDTGLRSLLFLIPSRPMNIIWFLPIIFASFEIWV
jgi:hypothetical protein